MNPYKFLPDNKLAIDTENLHVECTYECNWNRAEWKLDIKTISSKHEHATPEAETSKDLVDLLVARPLGYGKVIILQDGKILANILLKKP